MRSRRNPGVTDNHAQARSNRDGIGAQIRIGSQSNHMTTAVGYASASQFSAYFGMGQLKGGTAREP